MHFEMPATRNPVMPCTGRALRGALAVMALCCALTASAATPGLVPHVAAPPTAVPPGTAPPTLPTNPAPGLPVGRGHGNPPAPGSLQLGPAGRWWDNSNYAKSIGLKQEQQKRMDAIFNANKPALFNTYRSLKAEEAKLDTLQRAESPDEDKILAQIDKVSALRGQLTKASATLMLQLRKELTPEQIKQLESGL